MRQSADSYQHGGARRGKRRPKFDDEPTFAKRDRHRPHLAAEDADDATGGLPEGGRWSTWAQSDNLLPNAGTRRSGPRVREAPWCVASRRRQAAETSGGDKQSITRGPC